MFLWWIPWLLRSWACFVGILIFQNVANAVLTTRQFVVTDTNVSKMSDSRLTIMTENSELDINKVNKSSRSLRKMNIQNSNVIAYNGKLWNKSGFSKKPNEFVDSINNVAEAKHYFNNHSGFDTYQNVNSKNATSAEFELPVSYGNYKTPMLWKLFMNSAAKFKRNVARKPLSNISYNSLYASSSHQPLKRLINNTKENISLKNVTKSNNRDLKTIPRKEGPKLEIGLNERRPFINRKFKEENSNPFYLFSNDFLNIAAISSKNINSKKFKRKNTNSKMSYKVPQSSKMSLKNKNLTKSDKSVSSNNSKIRDGVLISICNKCLMYSFDNKNMRNMVPIILELLNSNRLTKRERKIINIGSDLNAYKDVAQERKRRSKNGKINNGNELNMDGCYDILLSRNRRKDGFYFLQEKGRFSSGVEVKRSKVAPQKAFEKGAAVRENTGRLEIKVAGVNAGRCNLFLRCRRIKSKSSNNVNKESDELNFEAINEVTLIVNKNNFVQNIYIVAPKKCKKNTSWRRFFLHSSCHNVFLHPLSISFPMSSSNDNISIEHLSKSYISEASLEDNQLKSAFFIPLKKPKRNDISQSILDFYKITFGGHPEGIRESAPPFSKKVFKRSVSKDLPAVNPSISKSSSQKNRKTSNAGGTPGSSPKKPKNMTIEEAGMGGSALQPPVSSTAQRFATQPAPQTAVIGSTAVLPCRVTGKVGHLQWTKDGFGLGTDRDLYGFSRYSMIGSDDEGDFSLRMNPVLLDDDALYQCQVSASDGVPGIRSQPVRLTVYVPPDQPVVEPTILNTTSGMAVEITCQSKGGRPPPEIQWVDDSKRETILDGATDSVQMMEDGKRTIVTSKLTFTPRRHHNNQSVTCLTSNQALSSPLTASISLHVFFPPEVTLSSHPEQFIEGDDATFYCDSVANPPRVTYRWFHNAQELVNETSRDLKISKIARAYHQDSISCEVSNKVGLSKKSQTMYVRFGPTFRTKPQDVMAEDGSNADLSCDVESNPTASISWLRDGSDKIIGSGASLRVQVSRSTAGIYKCIATVRGRDIEFPNLEGKVRVLVKGPPQIVSASEQQGRMGDTVSLECRTVSVPSPIRVTWTYKGRKIDLNDPRYDVLQDEGKGNHRNVLVIHDAESTDFGDYNCSVVNEYGVARKLIRLKEEKRVPVLLVVGCGASVILVAVVIVSLVFCNKKHPSNKGQSESAKNKPTTTEQNQAQIANMYSAASESKLDEGPLSSFPSPFTEVKVSPHPSNSVSYSMRPLNGENRNNTNAENFERDYTTFIETSTDLRGRRRSSLTDSSVYPIPGIGGANSAGATTAAPPEFCTIRRTPRTQSPPVISTYPNGNVGIGVNHRSANNGSLQLCSNRHSAYINSSIGHNQTSYSPPPPPPYPRNLSSTPLESGGITSPHKGGILIDNSGNLMTSNQEAKYIFSPEAMLKPGTLV